MRTQINAFTKMSICELLDVVTRIQPLNPCVMTRVNMRMAAEQVARVNDHGRMPGSSGFMKSKLLHSTNPGMLPYSAVGGMEDEGEPVILFCSSTRAYLVQTNYLLD